MNDDERRVVIYKISEYRNDDSGESRQTPVSPVNRWLSYAIMIPVVIVLALIGIFFFAAFFALAVVVVAVLAARFWLMRREIGQAIQQSEDSMQSAGSDQTVIIEDAQIVEETQTRDTERKY